MNTFEKILIGLLIAISIGMITLLSISAGSVLVGIVSFIFVIAVFGLFQVALRWLENRYGK